MRYEKVYQIPVTGIQGRLLIVSRPRGGEWLDDEIK